MKLVALTLSGALALSWLVPLPSLATERTERVLSDLARMERYFEANPELKTTRSSGWKPFSRQKWALDYRQDGQPVTPAQRMAVWEEKRRRAAIGRSSATWFELGPTNLSGRALAIAFDWNDVDNVYVGTASGGLWKSTNGGDTWSPRTDDLPSIAIGGVAVSPNDSDIVVIATGEGTLNGDRVPGTGIWRSTDAGATWAQTNVTFNLTQGQGWHFIKANPTTGTMFAGGNNGLYRSTDDGANWSQIQSGDDFWDFAWEPGSTTRCYTIGGGSTFGGNTFQVSTDDGLTWSNSTSGLPNSSIIGKSKLAVTAASTNTIYVHLSSSSTYGSIGIYRSTNSGSSWAQRSTQNFGGGQAWYNLTLAADPNDVTRVIAGGIENWASSNSAISFSEVGDGYGLGTDSAIHWDHHDMVYEPGSDSNVWAATDGGVWKSTDDGATWTSRREGINTYQFYDICVAQSDDDFLLGGTQDNGVPGRQGAATSWFTSNLFADGMVCNVVPTDASTVYAEAQGGYHVKSTDGGGSWFEILGGISGNGLWVTPTDLDPTNQNRLYTETSSAIWRTTNGGSLWTSRGNHSAIWIDISPADPDVVWTVEGRPYVTTNDGASWTQTSNYGFSTGGSETKVEAHPTDSQAAFVTFSGYGSGAHVARTTDRGSSWEDVTGDLPAQPVNTLAVDPQNVDNWYIGTDSGVWMTSNGGVNWMPLDSGLPNAVISDLEVRDAQRKLVAGTYGRGAFELNLATSVSASGLDVAASHLMLDPPFPNPVRDSALLRFAARHEGTASLHIYDVAGRLVSDLAEISGNGVVNRAVWHTDDVPAGVYFAVLQAGADRISQKVVVTR